MTDLLLGIDIGTGSSKGVLTTPDGEVLATATRHHEMSLPRTGHHEMDAEGVWWEEATSIIRELVLHLDGQRVAGVCVSGVGPCLLPTGDDYRPLRPAILYGIDARAQLEIDELTERFGAEEITARGGKALTSQAVGPKLLWLRRHEPEIWERTTRWFGCSSFVVARLTGEYVMDHQTASQCDPLYDLAEEDWAHDWVREVVGDLPMPRLVWPADVVGTITAEAAGPTGLPVGTPVCAGTVDAWAEAFSCGVRRPGELMLMYGSTMFFVQILDELRTHPLVWTTMGVEPGVKTLAAGMATSGSLTEWVRELTGGVPYEQLVQEAAAVRPGSEGLVLLPYFAGERTPIFDPHARGVVAGLSLRHRRGHLFRAVYEGIAFGIRQILELLEQAGGPADSLVAVGGGTQGGLWTQIVSDVTGREQLLPNQTIGASYGSALLAAIGNGLVPADTDWASVADKIVPDSQHTETYDGLYDIYREMYPATLDQVHRLALLQESSPD
jgi:xylulokinase